MNIAERILQNRFSIQKSDYGEQCQPPPPPPPPINHPMPSSFESPHTQITPRPPQNIQYNVATKPHHNQSITNHLKQRSHHTRPQSAKFKKTKLSKGKMPLTPPTKPSNYHQKTVPPIPIQQSYTPPSYPPNPPINTSRSWNTLDSPNRLHPNRVHTNTNHRIAHASGHVHVHPQIQNDTEMPLGWAKLKDDDGLYYFNVITGAKQRDRPQNDATQCLKQAQNKQMKGKHDPLAPPHKHPSDDMSIAEMEYRKNNGSVIFANIISKRNLHALIRQENWDMLVDAIYLNLSASDHVQVFKALRSIAENLFDEDDKYRILYADNKKVQQRILSRIGGYEFLRGLGFREITKRKLVCDEPDFDIVATAITSINAKLSILEEQNKSLPIIPNVVNNHYESVELDVNIDDYIRNKENENDNDNDMDIACEEKQSRLDTNELDINEGEEGFNLNNHKSNSNAESAYCSDEEDEKLPAIVQSQSNIMETDAGFDETEAYFRNRLEKRSRKRSLSWDNNNKNNINNNHNNNHRYTLPPKISDVFTIKNRKTKRIAHVSKRKTELMQRSSSLTSQRPRRNILNEVENAYVDSERKLTLQALQMNDEEDVESLFDDDDDDDDMKGNNNNDNDKKDSNEVDNDRKSTSATNRRDFHFGFNHNGSSRSNKSNNGYNRNRNTLSEGNLSKTWNRNIDRKLHNKISSQSPQSVRIRQKSPNSKSSIKTRSNSFNEERALVGGPMSILLPSEKKKMRRKENKKMVKQKTRQKIRKSVGAIWNVFHLKKKNEMVIEKWNREHSNNKDDDDDEEDGDLDDDGDDDYEYYGDPQQNMRDDYDIMTPNILNKANLNTKHKLLVVFADDTRVSIDADINTNCIQLICLSLEQRGWNHTMSHLFNLCIKNNENDEICAVLKDEQRPILALAKIQTEVNTINTTFVVTYKTQ